MKSGLVARGPPRSNATIFNPVDASSFATIPPAQPSPTMAISTGFSLVAIRAPIPQSEQVLNAQGLAHILLVSIGLDLVRIHDADTRKPDHLPRRLALVAAVQRIGEIALHGQVQHQIEKIDGGHSRKLNLALFQLREHNYAILIRETIKCCFV